MKKPADDLILPDRFVMSKDEMVKILDAVKDNWKRDNFNILQNSAYIANMELIKASIKLNDIKVLEQLYFSIITFVQSVQTLNTLKLSWVDSVEKNDSPQMQKSFQNLYEIQKNRIVEGKDFIEN